MSTDNFKEIYLALSADNRKLVNTAIRALSSLENGTAAEQDQAREELRELNRVSQARGIDELGSFA